MICNGWSCITGSGKPDYKPATSTRPSLKNAKKPEKLGYDTLRHSNTVFTQERKKVKISLYIRFVNDCLSVSYLSIPSTPLRRATSTDFHQKVQKTRKTGRWRSVEVKYILNTRRKKVNFFSHIERYGNDHHRPPPFAPPTGDGITNKHF